MKNDDNLCFKWSVTRALNPVKKNAERITKELKEQSEKLNWNGLEFPVELNQIGIFEKKNSEISVNVFGFEKDVYPLRLSKTKKEKNINLLLIQKHFTLIKNMSRLLSSQVSGHKESKSFCLNCLKNFPNEEKLKIHEEYCLRNQAIKIKMAGKESFISFIHHNRSIKVPFVVYADFEAFTEEISSCEQNQEFSFTNKYEKHKPSGFCYKIVCFDEKLFKHKPVLYRGKNEEDIGETFVEMLEEDIKKIHKKFEFSKKKIFKFKDKDTFEKATICWICQKEFKETEKSERSLSFYRKISRGGS